MTTRSSISSFLSQRRLALVGVSRSGKGFGNVILKDLRAKGYEIYPVHPEASVEGRPCPPSVLQLSEKVGGAVLVVPPSVTEKVVREVVQAAIPRVWMQQGSESAAAIRYCEENNVEVVHGQCILMFAEPTAFFHRAHRGILRLLGRLPR